MNCESVKAGIVFEFESASPEQTEFLGLKLGCLLRYGDVVCLHGELGAGKTVLIRGLTRGFLGESPCIVVTSPTYVLQHVYRQAESVVHHIDAYRMEGGGAEFEASGLGECFKDERAIVCIEWPERVVESIPENSLHLHLAHKGPLKRCITLISSNQRSNEIYSHLDEMVNGRIRNVGYGKDAIP